MTPEIKDTLFWVFVNLALGAALVCAYTGIKGILRRRGKDAVTRAFSKETEAQRYARVSDEQQARHDAHRATWVPYDANVEAQRAALEAAGPAKPYMISLSTHDYLWYVHVGTIHMPWKYENHTTRHCETAPMLPPKLEWGWRPVGPGQPTRAAAETVLARVIAPDTFNYLYDKDGLSHGRVAQPRYEDDDDA